MAEVVELWPGVIAVSWRVSSSTGYELVTAGVTAALEVEPGVAYCEEAPDAVAPTPGVDAWIGVMSAELCATLSV